MHLSELEQKRIALWGMGREGKTTLAFLRQKFPPKRFIIINDKPVEGEKNFVLESDIEDHLQDFDVVIKSPGISYYHEAVAIMINQGIEVTSATNIWFDLPKRGKVIAVTGSNGKSTTSALLHHIMTTLGLKAQLGGNIGTPLLSLSGTSDYYVVELSSYQSCDLRGRPDIAVLLNLHPEHIQWHKTHEQYYNDKCNLLRRGAPINITNFKETRTRSAATIYFNNPDGLHFGGTLIYDGKTIIGTAEGHPLIGDHNLENICAALTICKELGLDLNKALMASHSYPGLPHRLQIFATNDGYTYVNDSISTDPEATIAALRALCGKLMTLIVGGEDRQQDYRELCELIDQKMINVVCVYETGQRLFDSIKKAPKYQASNIEEAVKIARNSMPNSGTILLSPAAPSYDAFKDFEQRGNLFMALAKS